MCEQHVHAASLACKYAMRSNAELTERVALQLRAGVLGARAEPACGLDHVAWLALGRLFPGAPAPINPYCTAGRLAPRCVQFAGRRELLRIGALA